MRDVGIAFIKGDGADQLINDREELELLIGWQEDMQAEEAVATGEDDSHSGDAPFVAGTGHFPVADDHIAFRVVLGLHRLDFAEGALAMQIKVGFADTIGEDAALVFDFLARGHASFFDFEKDVREGEFEERFALDGENVIGDGAVREELAERGLVGEEIGLGDDGPVVRQSEGDVRGGEAEEGAGGVRGGWFSGSNIGRREERRGEEEREKEEATMLHGQSDEVEREERTVTLLTKAALSARVMTRSRAAVTRRLRGRK